MKYKDYGFRPLYKNFCIFPINSIILNALEGEEGIDEADGIMVYGYVDHFAGNTLEFIALTKHIDKERYSFIKLPDDARFFARAEKLAGEEFEFAAYGDSHLYEQFKSKIDRLSLYDMNENLAKSRSMTFLDEFRSQYNFDDVKVILYKEGLQYEGVWARIETLGKGSLIGTLMNEPKQDFKVNAGTLISFVANKGKSKEKSLIADLNEKKQYTPEELKDGKILKDALKSFKEDNNKYKFYSILEILKDSNVLVPKTKNGVELVTTGDKVFYPVYSELLETWQCEDDAQKIEMPFKEALKKAKNDKKLSGMVVNAYSDAFVIPKSMYEFLEELD